MKWKWLFPALLLSVVSIALAQSTSGPLFAVARQFGRTRPHGIQYDPNFNRLVMVENGKLLLADASTKQTQFVLYPAGAYNAYTFSHNGQYLALAVDRRVELWDTHSGERKAVFEPPAAKLVQGPLYFSPDDTWLLLDTLVPAPPELRRSENDTVSLPWLWDIPAALREVRSTRLPSLASAPNAYPFFSLKFPNTLVIGPNNYLIAGIPERLQVINGGQKDFPVVAEISAARLESDPISVWKSLTDDYLYINPNTGNSIVQVNTSAGTTFDIPLGRDLNFSYIEAMQGLGLSNLARILGAPVTQRENSLLRLLFGDDYIAYQGFPKLTVMLVDILEPLTVSADQMGLLVYTFNEERSSGMLEIVRPPDVQQMVLHPDRTRLLVRRASGLQPIEVYNLDTGVLEQSYFPAEPDSGGSHLLAYTLDGKTILTDFQQFDADSGESITLDPRYTSGFERFFFSADSQQLVTIRGAEWRLWDIETGDILQEATIRLNGSIMAQSPDAFRFLTRVSSNSGEVIEITDVAADERRRFTIPDLSGRSIENIIPSDDWQNYLVVYSPTSESQHYPGNEIAVYHFTRGQILFLAGDDLPAPDARNYGWLNNQTIYVSSANTYGGAQPARVYGVDYHVSGLPNCLVRTFPEQWSDWMPVWEGLTLNRNSEDLNRLAQRLCAALPDSADEVLPALTPTAPFTYFADVTPAPAAIPGVPICLTYSFPYEAVDYAALWREISAGLPEEQLARLEEMLCEGLIRSVYGIAPTPTPNINQLIPPTPTPLPAAPVTTDSSEQQLSVLTVNIETGQRYHGTYLPPRDQQLPDMGLIQNLFYSQYRYYPDNPVLSPDGTLLAAFDTSGNRFVVVYRMAKSYDTLLAEEAAAEATRQANLPHSIGLLPTATPPFNYVGEPRPTLTPTVTLTPPPRVETTARRTSQELCPASKLYDISAPPDGYAAAGRLFVPPVTDPYVTWVLEPETGDLYPDDTLPQCILNGGCNFSFDQEWMLVQDEAIAVSRPDGSDSTILFRPEERPVWPQDWRWLNLHTLEYHYPGYLPEKYPNPVTLIRQVDPLTGIRTEPFLPLPNVEVNDLPTTLVAHQPGNGTLELVSTPYRNGAKYYLYDRASGSADYFARVDSGNLEYRWHPLGRFLYYRYPDQPEWYQFDAYTRYHDVLGTDLPAEYGNWSRNGRYTVSWYSLPYEDQYKRLIAGQPLPKISIWDSETGLTSTYCIPETGQRDYSGTPLVWSPDNRYLAFVVSLPIEGDFFPTPTTTPDIPVPSATPVPLETQYQYQFPRTLILDTQTGSVTVLSTAVHSLSLWTNDGGEP
ncbi:MAG: WD40 repeat domain-containing protein [Chloroflexi bacterium]|nr:WD40 repeat domain-containing protein [Chloroflexota bacterium]